VVSVPAHKVLDGDMIRESNITAMAWNNHGEHRKNGDTSTEGKMARSTALTAHSIQHQHQHEA
jgi:hypothetical protein